MAAITAGVLSFRDVFQGDLFDVTISITGINLTGKTLECQVKENKDATAVLTFAESDDSLQKTIVDTDTTTLRFYKEAADMADIPPLSARGDRPFLRYYLTVVQYTDDSDIEDTQTIIEGTMEIVPQITLLS